MKEFEKFVEDMKEDRKVPEFIEKKCEETFFMLGNEECKEKTKRSFKTKRFFRQVFAGTLVAAACVCLVLFWGNQRMLDIKQNENYFNITVYAAETNGNENMKTEENAKVISMLQRDSDSHYTGCLFEIKGNNIKSVSGSMDKGEFYKFEYVKMTGVEYENLSIQGKVSGEKFTYNDYFYQLGSAGYCEQIGNEFIEEYDGEAYYGFYIPNDISETKQFDDLFEEAKANIDQLDGAMMTISVTYYDNSTESITYQLKTGKLEVTPSQSLYYDSFITEDKEYVYGILLEQQE